MSALVLAGMCCTLVFHALFWRGVWIGRDGQPYGALSRAARLHWRSVVPLAAVPPLAFADHAGGWIVTLSMLNVVLACGIAVSADRRRDRKFDETVKEWWK